VLVGCSADPPEAVDRGVTWEEAKAAAQARELEIVALIPSGDVARVDQHEKGGLFSCSETQHRWKGITDVTLVPGADAEAVTKRMEDRVTEFFPADDFEVSDYRGIADKYVAVLESPATGEGYLFGEGEPGTTPSTLGRCASPSPRVCIPEATSERAMHRRGGCRHARPAGGVRSGSSGGGRQRCDLGGGEGCRAGEITVLPAAGRPEGWARSRAHGRPSGSMLAR